MRVNPFAHPLLLAQIVVAGGDFLMGELLGGESRRDVFALFVDEVSVIGLLAESEAIGINPVGEII